MNIFEFVVKFETEWDEEGSFSKLRDGEFSEEMAFSILSLLRQIEIEEEEMVPKRALSLLWYLPSFLDWQKERVSERGGDVVAYGRFLVDVRNVLETVLGVP